MGGSNADWGHLAEHDAELAERWDRYDPLPDPGENDVLDAFVARKHIDISALVRIGARLSDYRVLAFAGPGYIKYRDMETDRRWTASGSTYPKLRIVSCRQGETDTVIVAEGETDAARLSMLYPECDVAILPAGARVFNREWADQLNEYQQVLASYDVDEAGDVGWAKLKEHVPHAQRFNAPEVKDWCEYEGDPPELPPMPAPEERRALPILVSVNELMDLEMPESASWFEHDILPIGGQLVLHAPAKSFKSYLALDMMAALAQGGPWACFEPLEEPCRVAVVQFEIPPKYYRDRLRQLREQAVEPELFGQNLYTWSPLNRPQLRAGDKKQEQYMRDVLVESGIQVVLLDPVRRLMGPDADMDKEAGARLPLQFMQSLQDQGITVVFCHHDNKAATRAGGGDPVGMTGSGAWAGDADTIVSVAIPPGMSVRDPKRDLYFLCRNAPSPGPRSMTMRDDGKIIYDTVPHGADGSDPGDPEAPQI